MNIHVSIPTSWLVVFLILLIFTTIYIVYELRRRQKLRRCFRNPCSYCGSENVVRQHLRVAISKDDFDPNLVNQGDMLCQTQKMCLIDNCTSHQQPNSPSEKTQSIKEKRWREEKTALKHFGWWHRTFHPHDCCPNAIPDELIGSSRRILLKKPAREIVEFKKHKLAPKTEVLPKPQKVS